ncbi:39S ribosomal protein L55, mitochondrial isoform X2 [Octopus sinensis]|uniref:39S ribosomal protein L55, mitochondrial isoform X2 n=1 Tax=Octopus sinensis TaxID=2607531 RepID=A0A6P7SN62_9MOLL|nr:39S ribosomal protein L55, mitochondrial isoform X2 [Octopus sinensis]
MLPPREFTTVSKGRNCEEVQGEAIQGSPSLLGSIYGRTCVRWNSNRTSMCKINRSIYKRMYPVTLVQPDGSTIVIRYKEPRRIITLPIDIETLTPEQKKLQLQKRKPKRIIQVVEDFEDDFDIGRYRHLWKK